MHTSVTIGLAAVAWLLCGCGDDDDKPEEPPMKVEDTVFGDLVGTQDKARDRANAAVETHREALDSRLEADESAPPEE